MGYKLKEITRNLCLRFFSGSFSACANSSDRFVCCCSGFQRFFLFLDICMASLSRDTGTVEDQDLLSVMLVWDLCKYASRCSSCYDACQNFEMAEDGDSISIYDGQGCSMNKCVSAYAHRWRAMSRSYPVVFSNIPYLDMPLIRRAIEKYVRQMREMSHMDISSDSDVVDLSRCCLPRPFCLLYPIREVSTWGRDVDYEVRLRLNGLLVGWDSIEVFAVPPARRGLV